MTLFPTTRWGEILAARIDPARRRELLGELSMDYRKPLLVLARACGLRAEDAEDAVQEFLTSLLERDATLRFDPDKGRLRSYLRSSMRNFLADRNAKQTAAKRGGRGQATVALDDISDVVADSQHATPEELYDRAFAIQVVAHTLAQLEAEFTSGRWSGPFAAVRAAFAMDQAAPPIAELAQTHGMTLPQMTSFLHRARERFRKLLHHRVRELVADVADTDTELRALMVVLGA